MHASSVESIVEALNLHQVKYLIAGGLAVVAHGHVRFTADVDLMLAMDDANLHQALAALRSLNYFPRAPVAIEQFADASMRKQWAREKHMIVFSLYSPDHKTTEIDLFLEPPVDFSAAYARAADVKISPNVSGKFCSLDDLIKMKSMASRPQDLEDIAKLRRIHPEKKS